MDIILNSRIPKMMYDALQSIGYAHPVHPIFTHIPIGLTIGGFLFLLAALLLKRATLFQTARHCMVMTLIVFPFTVFFGWVDWVHFYGGAWLFPFEMKAALAVAFLMLLLWGAYKALRSDTSVGRLLFINFLSLLAAAGLGFFGGELVYGGRPAAGPATGENPAGESGAGENPDGPAPARAELAAQGADLFSQSCSGCHYTDKTASKIGPGLKALFEGGALPASGRKATEANIRVQLRTPFRNMPAFPDLSKEHVDALIAYMKTL